MRAGALPVAFDRYGSLCVWQASRVPLALPPIPPALGASSWRKQCGGNQHDDFFVLTLPLPPPL